MQRLKDRLARIDFVVGVNKAYQNSHGHRKLVSAKRVWHVYGYTKEGKFVKQRVDWLTAQLYKRKIVKIRTRRCGCGLKLKVFDPKLSHCPSCLREIS